MASVFGCCCLALPASPEDVPPTAVSKSCGAWQGKFRGVRDSFIHRERRRGTQPNEIERWYYGPPKNVVQDAVQAELRFDLPLKPMSSFNFSLPVDTS
jgi:hypothetical protein